VLTSFKLFEEVTFSTPSS